MTWPAATRKDHVAFCETEEWVPVRDARGRGGTHHIVYEIGLPDGSRLRTRISRPPDRSAYGPALWGHILRDQLNVTEDEFWACVRDGVRPDRGIPPSPADSLPADLVYLLITRVGVQESEVAAMSRQEAVDRLQAYWIDGS